MLSQSVPFPGLSSLGPAVAAPQCSQGISSGLQPGSSKLLKDSHERGLSWINCPGSTNLVSATLFLTPLLGCSKLFLQAGAVGRICAMHRVADLALLVLRLTGQICCLFSGQQGRYVQQTLCFLEQDLLLHVGLIRGSTTCPGRKTVYSPSLQVGEVAWSSYQKTWSPS